VKATESKRRKRPESSVLKSQKTLKLIDETGEFWIDYFGGYATDIFILTRSRVKANREKENSREVSRQSERLAASPLSLIHRLSIFSG
jgi:hypothetical protein